MIKRIVCMEVRPEAIENVEKILRENFFKIQSFKGCLHLEILKDHDMSNRFFSYSIWESSADLENYRSSEFFKKFWKNLKTNFQTKARAWSLVPVEFKPA